MSSTTRKQEVMMLARPQINPPLYPISKFVFIGLFLLAACLGSALPGKSAFPQESAAGVKPPVAQPPSASIAAYIDNHTHPDGDDMPGSVEAAVQAMGRENAVQIVFVPPPFKGDTPGKFDAELILSAAKKYPGKLVAYGGGGSLNVLLQDAVTSGKDVEQEFRKRADELVRLGVAGFGEISLEHFSPPNVSDYQYAPADHPLMLMLADIAAKAGIPIVVHMEAVRAPMPLPKGLKIPPHPAQLHENIAAFERMLSHNPQAKIIWAHVGADYTGNRTPELCRQLLERHPNLFMEIKVEPPRPGFNSPLPDSGSGPIKPEWLKLFQDFPDQLLVGTDQHYGAKEELFTGRPRWGAVVGLLNQLPAEVRSRIALDTARRLRPVNAKSPIAAQ
jgi:predicted TIM-barrel fold metal-dependent hydrolase